MVKANSDVIPPLRDGDRLSGAEYWRRYMASPEGTRAELLRGVVYLHRRGEGESVPEDKVIAPANDGLHGEPQLTLGGELSRALGELFGATGEVREFRGDFGIARRF